MLLLKLVLALLLMMVVCNCVPQTGAPPTIDNSVAQGKATALLPTDKTIPKDLVITKSDTGCCIAAPTYALTVFADGSIVIEERAYKTGTVTRTVRGKINDGKLRQLIFEFEKAKFFSLNSKYESKEDGCPEVGADADTFITSIKIGGREKSIRHFWGCEQEGNPYPAELTGLEEKIDEIVDVRKILYPEPH